MKKDNPQLIVADNKGRIYNLPDLTAAGMKGGCFFRLSAQDLIKLPAGSELFMLPQRKAIGFDDHSGQFIAVENNPVSRRKEPCFALAGFASPGFTISYNSCFRQIRAAVMLPLFSYAAVAFYKGEFYITAQRVDREKRQDLRLMDINLVRKNVAKFRKIFSGNRLVRHLENCALAYACPAAKNFFLQRYEAPLPTSPTCNARCSGCISQQPSKGCSITQPRIKFIPTPQEVAEIALFHIEQVPDPVVSFGQGCEGEPMLVGGLLEKTIAMIRKKTSKGMINLNTNASCPKVTARLFDAGLDSIRVSLNSVREEYYARYYKPKGYNFSDVLDSIRIAKQKAGFVSLNYLTMPGFTDLSEEFTAFKNFIATQRIDMIQWRNLNFDPLRYFRELKLTVDNSQMLGIPALINQLKQDFPRLLMGYFNPSKLRIKRHQSSK